MKKLTTINLGFHDHPLYHFACAGLSCIFLLSAPFAIPLTQGAEVSEHYDGVLGTSLDITIYTENESPIASAIEMAVTEIARLEEILSPYNGDSELMQLHATRTSSNASEALLDVIQSCEKWKADTNGNFSCRLGAVVDFWDAAEEAQQLPSRDDVGRVARRANRAELIINSADREITLGEGIKLDPSGLAKGYIIDTALAVLRSKLPEATAIKVDIGGDAAYWGIPPEQSGWEVMIADPEATSDNSNFISSLSLGSKAVATSGHNSRKRKILMRELSHLFTPTTGWPILNGLYAVVIADDAITADALATALSVQSIANASAMIESIEGVEALLIDHTGAQRGSSGWNAYLSEELIELSKADFQLTLNYTIPDMNVRGYKKPYVAIWVSDIEKKAIKNLALLGSERRWAGSNSRWWRRAGRLSTLQKSNVTRATRPPGEYQLNWDGRDDSDTLIGPGQYLLNVEASREDGGHTHRSVEFSFEEGIQTLEQARYGEVGDFSFTVEISFPD